MTKSLAPNLLTCVALSPRAAAVAKQGARVAELLGLPLRFVHVGPETPQRRAAVSEVLGAAGIDAAADALVFRAGAPGAVICSVAAELGSQVIVMGALDRDPPLTRIWGSVARQVARQAPCSVLLLPDPKSSHASVDRIVARVDLDAESAAMTTTAIKLARWNDQTRIDFVHEFSVSEVRWAESGGYQETDAASNVEQYIRQQREDRVELLREFLSSYDLDHVTANFLALPGKEGFEVIEHARRVNADLLIVPTPYRRLTFWDRFFQHPAELALRLLPCGLFLYRPPR